MSDRSPRWSKGVPWCSENDCPSYDGKRCGELGFRPDRICEPQVTEMGAERSRYRDALEEIADGNGCSSKYGPGCDVHCRALARAALDGKG